MDHEEGMKTRREVLGDEHVDRATASAGAFGAPFQELITKYAWGAVWSRPGLDRRTRSAVTLAALVSARAENELAMHVRAALAQRPDSPRRSAEVLLHRRLCRGSGRQFGLRRGAPRVLSQEDGGLIE